MAWRSAADAWLDARLWGVPVGALGVLGAVGVVAAWLRSRGTNRRDVRLVAASVLGTITRTFAFALVDVRDVGSVLNQARRSAVGARAGLEHCLDETNGEPGPQLPLRLPFINRVEHAAACACGVRAGAVRRSARCVVRDARAVAVVARQVRVGRPGGRSRSARSRQICRRGSRVTILRCGYRSRVCACTRQRAMRPVLGFLALHVVLIGTGLAPCVRSGCCPLLRGGVRRRLR